jgi:mannose-6-phosphate isomerase-like protein (cupin superfamily)
LVYNQLMAESADERSKRILNKLRELYPDKDSFDLDGRGLHFVCELEPSSDHPEFDRAIEVIIESKPHKHLKMTQYYSILSGNLEFHSDHEVFNLKKDDKITVKPGTIHWARSENECWVEIYSEPGWTKEDHITI